MKRELIIEKPEAQEPRKRLLHRTITVLFWVLYLYLWRPILLLLAWTLGIRLFARVMVVEEGYRDLLQLLGWYAMTIIGIGLILEGWSMYNLLRFRRNEKRTRQPQPITVEQTANYFDVAPGRLARWRESRRMEMHLTPDGKVLRVDTP